MEFFFRKTFSAEKEEDPSNGLILSEETYSKEEEEAEEEKNQRECGQKMQPVNKSWPTIAMDLFVKSELSEEPATSSTAAEGDKCWVCGCTANGRHYGVMACFGCKGFFRRSVQGGKNYVCRHDRQCVIDQSDRNCCRACRFQKCLSVGMDTAAIQPDRDKTGRQRNPRKSAYSTRPNSSSPSEPPPDSQNQNSDSESEPSATDRIVMDTLVEIEKICDGLKMEISTSYQSLLAAVEKPSTVFSRTSVCFNGENGDADPRILRDDGLRLCVLMLDYVNTLRPLADVPINDKMAVVRQCLAPFIVLVLGFHAARQPNPENVYLPSGHLIRPDNDLLNVDEDNKQDTLLLAKSRALHRNFMDQVVLPLRRMNVTLPEMAAVKAILTLDPHAPGIGDGSSMLLTTGREAVQKALYGMLRGRYRSSDATARFGHLLMIITAVARVSSQLLSLVQLMKDASSLSDPVLIDLLQQIY